MGYNYQCVLADTTKIAGIFGCQDDAKFNTISNHPDSYVQFLLREDERKQALEDIICGRECDTLEAHHYGYAMEAICFAFGLRAGELDTRDEQRAYELLEAVGARIALFMDRVSETWFAPIPDTPSYPLVGVITMRECDALARSLVRALSLVEQRGVSGWEQEQGLAALRRVHEACELACHEGSELIIFLH